jgi:hypothetical protein
MGLGGVFDNGCGKVAQAAGWGGKLAMSSVVVIHVSDLEAQGVNYHQGHSFTSGRAGSPVLQCGEESSFSNFSCLRL